MKYNSNNGQQNTDQSMKPIARYPSIPCTYTKYAKTKIIYWTFLLWLYKGNTNNNGTARNSLIYTHFIASSLSSMFDPNAS